MTHLGRAILAVTVAIGLGFWTVAPSGAQTTSASVFGQVMDSQGGVLPGATATLTSKSQAYTLTATTDAEGRFVFAIVRPDSYVLRVSMEGFKTLERTTVQVSANDRFFAGVLTLDVGAITEEVSVTGRVSELQATSGERSYTMESEVLKNVANNGRSLFTFATLVPGVLSQNAGANNPETQVSSFTVNGQRPNSNNMTIDGVANIDTGDNGGNMAQTNIDAVAEFKILTNAYQAEYGRAVGGQVQVVTKSGTQAFHGSGYWYGRRSDWNANTWTNKRAAAPAPV
ncbi:MAG TPA: carboxypeptidase regulatory-like domain-containing protein, partial [Vicinamibacterales bacterium]